MNIIEYENYREKKKHTEDGFPYNTYLCSIPLDFVAVPTHWHDECEIIYVKKGIGIVSIDFHEYRVTAPAVFIIMPGRMHSIMQYEKETMEYENILFHPDIFYSKRSEAITDSFLHSILSGQLAFPELMLPSMEGYELIASSIDACDDICSDMPEGYQLFVKGKLFDLMYSITKLSPIYSANKSNQGQQLSPSGKRQLYKIKPLLKYIEEGYHNDITVATAADICGFSEAHFMRFFKELMGSSFVTYLNDYRLTMAARLLLMSDDDILNISESVGFQNLSHFNRSFKKRYNSTPSEYRKSRGVIK